MTLTNHPSICDVILLPALNHNFQESSLMPPKQVVDLHENTFESTDGHQSIRLDGLHQRLAKKHDAFTTYGNLVVADFVLVLQRITLPRQIFSVTVPISNSNYDIFDPSSVVTLSASPKFKDRETFYRYFKDIAKEGTFNPIHHSHSEIYLYYNLWYNIGDVLDSLQKKLLATPNTLSVIEARIHLHSTNSVCGSCTKFTKGDGAKAGFIKEFSLHLKDALNTRGFAVPASLSLGVYPSYNSLYNGGIKMPHLSQGTQPEKPLVFTHLLAHYRQKLSQIKAPAAARTTTEIDSKISSVQNALNRDCPSDYWAMSFRDAQDHVKRHGKNNPSHPLPIFDVRQNSHSIFVSREKSGANNITFRQTANALDEIGKFAGSEITKVVHAHLERMKLASQYQKMLFARNSLQELPFANDVLVTITQ